MAITQGDAEKWIKNHGGSVESHATDQGWVASARLGDVTAEGDAPDEAEARYVAIVKLRKIVGKTNPQILW